MGQALTEWWFVCRLALSRHMLNNGSDRRKQVISAMTSSNSSEKWIHGQVGETLYLILLGQDVVKAFHVQACTRFCTMGMNCYFDFEEADVPQLAEQAHAQMSGSSSGSSATTRYSGGALKVKSADDKARVPKHTGKRMGHPGCAAVTRREVSLA